MPFLYALFSVLLIAACAPPDLGLPDTPRIEDEPAPRLLPLTEVLDAGATPSRAMPGTPDALAARATRLRERAAAMRSSALTDDERRAISAAQSRLGDL